MVLSTFRRFFFNFLMVLQRLSADFLFRYLMFLWKIRFFAAHSVPAAVGIAACRNHGCLNADSWAAHPAQTDKLSDFGRGEHEEVGYLLCRHALRRHLGRQFVFIRSRSVGLRLRKALPESSLLQGCLETGGSIGGFRHGGQGGFVVFDLLLQMLKAQSQHNRGANARDPDNASKHEWYQQSRHGN
jgi:hypothetical protein